MFWNKTFWKKLYNIKCLTPKGETFEPHWRGTVRGMQIIRRKQNVLSLIDRTSLESRHVRESSVLSQSWCYSSNRGGGESLSWKFSIPDWAEVKSPVFSLLWQWESSERMDNLDGPRYKQRSWSHDCSCWRSNVASTNTFFLWTSAPASWCTDVTRVWDRERRRGHC